MYKIKFFDYRKVAKKLKVPYTIMVKLEKEIKKEFPDDPMLYELHLLRAVKSQYWLHV